MNSKNLSFPFLFLLNTFCACAQESDAERSKKTEVWSPVPKIVTPAKQPGAAPSDAIILFDGKNLDQWVSKNDTTKPASWTVNNGVLTVKKGRTIGCSDKSYFGKAGTIYTSLYFISGNI